MATRNGNGNGNGTRRRANRPARMELDRAHVWLSKGGTRDARRVIVKLEGIPQFAVPQGTTAEAELLASLR